MKSLVSYLPTGEIWFICHPDNESQLDDPQLNPKGCECIRVERTDYDQCRDHHEINILLVDSCKDQGIKTSIQAVIQKEMDRRFALVLDMRKTAATVASLTPEQLEVFSVDGEVPKDFVVPVFDQSRPASLVYEEGMTLAAAKANDVPELFGVEPDVSIGDPGFNKIPDAP